MLCFPCCLLHCSGAEAAALIRRLLLVTGINTQMDHANIDVHEPLLQERANYERPVYGGDALWSEEVIEREQRRLESNNTDSPTSPRFSDKESFESNCVHISADPQPGITPLHQRNDNASAAASERSPPLKKAAPKPPPKGFEVLRDPCFCCRQECELGMKKYSPSPEWPKACLPKHSLLPNQPPALTKPPASSRWEYAPAVTSAPV